MLTLVLLNVLAIILESDAAVLIIIGKRGFDYFEFASVSFLRQSSSSASSFLSPTMVTFRYASSLLTT